MELVAVTVWIPKAVDDLLQNRLKDEAQKHYKYVVKDAPYSFLEANYSLHTTENLRDLLRKLIPRNYGLVDANEDSVTLTIPTIAMETLEKETPTEMF